MSESHRVNNPQGFRPPEDPKREGRVDSDSFKRIMKVDESEEAEKRRKRNRPKQEEEEEEEFITTPTPPAHAHFSHLMKDSKETDSIFDVTKTGTAPKMTSEAPGTFHDMISEDQRPVENQPPPEEEFHEEISTPTLNASDLEDNFAPKTPEPKATQTESHTEHVEKKPAAKKAAKAKEKTKTAPATHKPRSPYTSKKPHLLKSKAPHVTKKAVDQQEVPFDAPAQPAPPQSTHPIPPTEKEAAIQEARPTPSYHKPHHEDKEEPTAPITPTEHPFAPTAHPEPIQQVQPSYTHLHPQVFDLFQRMVGVMMVEQHKGVSTTTITLKMPGSVFNDCKVKIEHFDTAPHQFNVQLIGSAAANNTFMTNMKTLETAFRQGNYGFEVNLLRPVLPQTEASAKKKGATKRRRHQAPSTDTDNNQSSN
ncbi:MAG: hypothetical protein S4CHLAM102_12640 [Chlamydiia bacterium]|nr:hypothetical protein [Chlamydiia bacterium]